MHIYIFYVYAFGFVNIILFLVPLISASQLPFSLRLLC